MADRCQQCRAETIADLVRAGDRAALDRITRCYGRHLLEVGRRVCGDGESARDAVQDALLAAGQHLDHFRGDGSVEGWLVRMVANACRTRLRGRKNQAAWNAPLDDAIAGAAAPTDGDGDARDPEAAAAHAELADALAAALGELGPVDRAIVLLTQLDGWSGPDVAASLALTPEAVRARLTRARRRMRARLSAVGRDWLEGRAAGALGEVE